MRVTTVIRAQVITEIRSEENKFVAQIGQDIVPGDALISITCKGFTLGLAPSEFELLLDGMLSHRDKVIAAKEKYVG